MPALRNNFVLRLAVSFACTLQNVAAEDPPLEAIPKGLALGSFIDVYAAHDFNDPFTQIRPYTTQPVYEDQARVNLAFIEANLRQQSLRGRLALQAGDSVKANYAAEKDLFWRYIQEATTGIKINDRLWVDGGIYFAHVGLETFNSRDNWNYTRSLVADYSPYYETGLKLTYQLAETLSAQLHVVHGWQNISSSAEPMYGTQLNYTPDSETQLTYANLVGDQEGGLRVFHDLISKRDITASWSVAAQFDFGTQEREDDDTAAWHGWALLTKYGITSKLSVGGRVERFYDPHQILITTLDGGSFNATGISTNIDYQFSKNLLWRTEYRAFFGRNEVFPEKSPTQFSTDDHLIVTSLAVSLDLEGII